MPRLPRLRALDSGVLILAAVAVTCTIPDYPARPDDVDKGGVSGGEGGDSGERDVAGAGGLGSGADGGLADGGHPGERTGECGDGARVSSEECDDGNVEPNDGCSASCRREIVQIALGSEHSCVRFDNAEVACWGRNRLGQLGIGSNENIGDTPNELGANLIETNLGSSLEVLELSLGAEFSCARLEGGKVKCWGANESGQLCTGDTEPRGMEPDGAGDKLPPIDLGEEVIVKQISCGERHCCAIVNADKNGGEVKCWGANESGQLGLGNPDHRGDTVDELGDELHSVDLGSGHLAKSVTLGNQHTCALLEDDSVRCWGLGSYGQLGNGFGDNRGDTEGEMGDQLISVDFGPGLKAKQIEAGGFHTCAILDDDTLKCWGDNEQAQLGIGSEDLQRGDQAGQMGANLPSVNLGRERRAVRVTAGEYFTCVLLDDASVKCWGDNFHGELGQGNQERIGASPAEMGDQLKPVDLGAKSVLEVAAGTSHACAIVDSGRVKCWGFANSGALGLGDEQNNLGDAPNEMGDELLTVPLLKK